MPGEKKKKGWRVTVRTPKESSGMVDKFMKSTISLEGPRPQKRRGMPHPTPKPPKSTKKK